MRVFARPNYQRRFTVALALVWGADGNRSPKQTFYGILRRRHLRWATAHSRATAFHGEMDLARRRCRLRYRIAEPCMANATSLAHIRALEQYLSQQQERRSEPRPVHLAAGCFHEPSNASIVGGGIVLAVRFEGWKALHGAWNHVRSASRHVHHYARQKLLFSPCVSDAFCGGRRGSGENLC